MASPSKKLKVDIPGCTKSDPPTKYKNMHCSQACSKLYLQEETADVHFVFQTGNEEKRLPAHKFILGIGSPVFRSMFYDSLQEEGDIRIMDATIDAFKEFLQFFYLDNVNIAMEYVDEMMYLADKYNITECFKVCETFLRGNLSIENICYVLQLAITFDRRELLTFLLAKISKNPTQVFASKSFQNCAWSMLKLILEIVNLDCDEKAVFDACMAWSEKACEKNNLNPLEMENRREQLGDCFQLIRFSVMKPPHISQCVSKYKNLFTRDELVDIIAILASENPLTLRRSRIIRQWNDHAMLIFSRDYSSDEKRYKVMKTDVTTFKTNKTLLLGSVATPPINPRTRDTMEIPAVMKIYDFTSGQLLLLLEQPVKLALGGKYEPRNVIKLTQTITVEANHKYEIRIEFGSSWAENVYMVKKITTTKIQSLGDCEMFFGAKGIVSHFYFN